VKRLHSIAASAAIAFAGFCSSTFSGSAATEKPPHVAVIDKGAPVENVTVEAYGFVKPEVAMRYLTLHKGDTVTQEAVDRDYANLVTLGDLRTRLEIDRDPLTGGATLHWIVMGKWLRPTDHPFYADQPLSFPIEGLGWIATAPQLDNDGSTVSTYSQLSARSNLMRVVYTHPVWVDPEKGREGDVIVNAFGGTAVDRADAPLAVNIYSWYQGAEAAYLVTQANGTSYEFGYRNLRATSDRPTFITAPSLQDTYYTPARLSTLEAAVTHGCPVPPTRWHPPLCYLQYRFGVDDAIGALGGTHQFQSYFADAAQYNRVGQSTFVVHGGLYRTAGVLPTIALVCATGLHAYAKGTCGTDANVVQAEYRFNDATPSNVHFVLFGETGSSRVRGGDQSFAPGNFTWRADAGIGVLYKGFRINVAQGGMGNRLSFDIQGQLF
jgi:hypothetical protein